MDDEPEQESVTSALRRHGLAPRKRLGQNFLRDRSYLDRIVAAAEIEPNDVVLELGAGTGVLTRALLRDAGRVVAVELDDSLAAVLAGDLGHFEQLRVWHGNALAFDPCVEMPERYKVVGNIPYYVTGPLIRHFLETQCRPCVIVFMVQREVAERIVAKPGQLSLLGVSVQYYAEARIVTRVP